MEQLIEKHGAVDFFLMTAATNVSWESGSTDIDRDKLLKVADAVNSGFGTTLDSMDVRLIWAKLRARWETWVRAKYCVRGDQVDDTVGMLRISDYTWDLLLRVVPDSELFIREPMISSNMVCSVFTRSPLGVAPEEHANNLRSTSSSGTTSRKRGPSPDDVKQAEINYCMGKVCEIEQLANSEDYMRFCFDLFEKPEIREIFNYLPNNPLRYQYVLKKYDEDHAP